MGSIEKKQLLFCHLPKSLPCLSSRLSLSTASGSDGRGSCFKEDNSLCGISFKHLVPLTGFPWRLENLRNENGHGKVMEHKHFAKSHRVL